MQNLGGLQSLLKEGSRHFSGTEEAILRNIEACKQLATVTRTSLGPLGMNKIIVNHLEKIFVTSDASTITKEMEVHHPAAKLIVMASNMQETEVGDGTNFLIILVGELLKNAENLINMGLHTSDIISGYEKGAKKALEEIDTMSVKTVDNPMDFDSVAEVLKCAISSKMYGDEDIMADLAAEACIGACENDNKFNVDNVRVLKILGGSMNDSEVVKGMIAQRPVETSVKHVTNAKIAVFNCPFDPQESDTKGTVLLQNAAELMNYTRSEEELAQKIVKEIADAGVNVVVSGGSVAEMCLHYLEQAKIMVLKVASKFELRRISRAVNAPTLTRLGAPTPEEMGHADEVRCQEISSSKVTIFSRGKDSSQVSTIVLRAGTTNTLDDAERAIDDAVNTYRMLRKDSRFCGGAGAVEANLSSRLQDHADKEPGLDQYSYRKFAEAFEVIPRTLAENSGENAGEILSKMYAANSLTAGIDINDGSVGDTNVFDHLESKKWAIKLASDCAVTILRVDQIIMSKPAGGPKPRQPGPGDQ